VALKREGFADYLVKYCDNEGIKEQFGIDLVEEAKKEEERKI
jgi:hypothetical protein